METRLTPHHLAVGETERGDVDIGIDDLLRHDEVEDLLVGLKAAGAAGIDDAARIEIGEEEGQRAGGVHLADAGLRDDQVLVFRSGGLIELGV